ncbi:MAG: phage portal protein [Clostridia bacterium]|nr:phage portal protein [Clostridia bacterium]
MGIFRRSRVVPAAATTQIRSIGQHPFNMLDNYVPLGGGDIRLYRAIREAVPVVDAAIMKIVRLTGGFAVECENTTAEKQLNAFLRTVNAGRSQRGINAFLDSYLSSMLTCGRAVGEIVTDGNREITAILCGNVCDVQVKEGTSPLDFVLCGRGEGGSLEVFPYQELILFTPFNPEPDEPYGVSMLRSMPFLTEILLKIYQSIGTNWERFGNVRYAVVYKPQGDIIDKTYATERTQQIAREWSAAMQSGKNGSVRDFVAVGDVDIKVIGADNQMLDSEVPVRQILEQLVARTGIPPFMLGLNWSSTERMSAQQADLMTSELTAIRRSLEPVIGRICELWLTMHGYGCGFEIVWEEINLQDAVEMAKAELYLAQAQGYQTENNPDGGNYK